MNPSIGRRFDSEVLAGRGPVVAAALAVVAGLPALRLPFLSDDWIHLATAAEGVIGRTAFGYFRPLASAVTWIEWRVWGLNAWPYHLMNVILMAVVSALVVRVVRQYTGDAALAGTSGVLFALHPYHVENVAWVAGRADLLSGVLFLCAVLTYDRWRKSLRALPFASLALYEAALLAKENAIVLPAFLLAVGLFDRRRRPSVAEGLRGYLPLVLLGLAHVLLVRPLALGGLAVGNLRWLQFWKGNLLHFSTALVLPAQTELLQLRPLVAWLLGFIVGGALLAMAWAGSRRIPPLIWPAAAAFVILLGPSLIAFQQRFFVLPGAAGALFLAVLLRGARRRVGVVAAALLLIGWSVAAVDLWTGWIAAGRASERLMHGLVRASVTPGVKEIVVVAMPHRVHGAPVRTDFTRVLAVAGGQPVEVRAAVEIDYPGDGADALARPRDAAMRVTPTQAEVLLRAPQTLYSRYVVPAVLAHGEVIVEGGATIAREDDGALRVRVPAAAGRAVHLWVAGELRPLLRPDAEPREGTRSVAPGRP